MYKGKVETTKPNRRNHDVRRELRKQNLRHLLPTSENSEPHALCWWNRISARAKWKWIIYRRDEMR